VLCQYSHKPFTVAIRNRIRGCEVDYQFGAFSLLDYDRSFEVNGSVSSLVPFTLKVNDRICVRLYRDSRPWFLEVAPLHKGLVLLFDGKELVEEGMGFGAPVVKFKDKTYFSSSASCSFSKTEDGFDLTKSFVLDTISRKRLGDATYLNEGVYRVFHRLFEMVYLGHTSLFPFFNKIMELRHALKVQTEFVKVTNRGTIGVNYSVRSDSVEVRVDLTGLEKVGCENILILNEQGSTFFRQYSDSEGLSLNDAQIGPWSEVKTKEAYLSYLAGAFRFGLEVRDKTLLFRGWEKTKGRFAWAGLSYCLSPQQSFFDYVIKFENCA
jgi:hypothetical protein